MIAGLVDFEDWWDPALVEPVGASGQFAPSKSQVSFERLKR